LFKVRSKHQEIVIIFLGEVLVDFVRLGQKKKRF